MIELNIKKVTKTINVNGKTIEIPKLGLSHRLQFNTEKSYEENLKILLKSIHPNLSAAEKEIVTLHILEFNGKIKTEANINGEIFKLDDVYISQKLKFEYENKVYKFKTPNSETEGTIDIILNKCCVSVKENNKEIEVPNFLDMPPFVSKWFDQITTLISLKGSKGTVLKNINEIIKVLE